MAPFRYITELEKTLKERTYMGEELDMESRYRSLEASNIKPFSFSVSRGDLKEVERKERIVVAV